MKDDDLKDQISDIIEGEIQNGINDYLEDMYDVPFEVVEDAYPDIQWGGRS